MSQQLRAKLREDKRRVKEISKPYVSVVISTYNRKDDLRKMIESLLNQTYQKSRYEIIVIDDGSIDGTDNMVKEKMKDAPCGMRYFYQKNRGPAVARNKGISLSRGEIIAFTDDDCVVDHQWLEFLTQRFLVGERIGGVRGKVITDKAPAIYLANVAPIDPTGHKYVSANIAYRKSALKLAGLFDERFKVAFREDSDLAYSVLKNGRQIVYEPNAIVYHPLKKLGFLKIIKSALVHEFDVLLHLKHPKIPKDVLGSILTQPITHSFSLAGLLSSLFFTCLLIATCIFDLTLVLGALVCSLAIWIIFFITYGYQFVSSPRSFGRIPIKSRMRNALSVLVYLFLLTLARVYGTVKYKHFFV